MTRACLVLLCGLAGAAPVAVAAPPEKTTAADRTAVKSPKGNAGAKAIRTIDEINIEGEIAVPQVLFITSRDNRRYRDGVGKLYRTSTLDVAQALSMPKRLCVAGKPESEAVKEE